jgi:D-sedoheptulose 7-phosphate isomerase
MNPTSSKVPAQETPGTGMKTPQEIIREHAGEGARLRRDFFDAHAALLDGIAFALASRLAANGKILVCGNGGSAADAQHFAGELVGRFMLERPALPVIALTVDSSVLTAVGNDYGYGEVFARQVEALGRAGDVLLALSTSGNSPNVLQALAAARAAGMLTVGMTGKGGGKMAPLCDHLVAVPHESTPLVQEIHGTCGHLLCRLAEYYLFENASALQSDGPQGA